MWQHFIKNSHMINVIEITKVHAHTQRIEIERKHTLKHMKWFNLIDLPSIQTSLIMSIKIDVLLSFLQSISSTHSIFSSNLPSHLIFHPVFVWFVHCGSGKWWWWWWSKFKNRFDSMRLEIFASVLQPVQHFYSVLLPILSCCLCNATALVNGFFLCWLSFIHSVIYFIDINNHELEYEKQSCFFLRYTQYKSEKKSLFNVISLTFFPLHSIRFAKELGFIHLHISWNKLTSGRDFSF